MQVRINKQSIHCILSLLELTLQQCSQVTRLIVLYSIIYAFCLDFVRCIVNKVTAWNIKGLLSYFSSKILTSLMSMNKQ